MLSVLSVCALSVCVLRVCVCLVCVCLVCVCVREYVCVCACVRAFIVMSSSSTAGHNWLGAIESPCHDGLFFPALHSCACSLIQVRHVLTAE